MKCSGLAHITENVCRFGCTDWQWETPGASAIPETLRIPRSNPKFKISKSKIVRDFPVQIAMLEGLIRPPK